MSTIVWKIATNHKIHWGFLSDLCGIVQILTGNLAPEGCVAKITGKEGLQFSGPAAVFDSALSTTMPKRAILL
jgi:hypothetical protein